MVRGLQHLRILAAAGLIAAAAAACGSGSNGSAGSGASGGQAGAPVAGAPSWCGSKKVTVALADGFGDNNWRRITRAEAKAEAALCPSVTRYLYTDGQGNTQKAISDIQGLVAQGVN